MLQPLKWGRIYFKRHGFTKCTRTCASKRAASSKPLKAPWASIVKLRECVWNYWNVEMPIALSIVAGLGISASDDDKSEISFEDWFVDHAFTSASSIEDVADSIKQHCAQISDSQLEFDFVTISRVLEEMLRELISKDRLESALIVLELHWSLMKRIDAIYKFPSPVSRILALESALHRELGDFTAAEKSDILLWKILKQYEWVGDHPERRQQQRAQIAFSLATASSSSHDCDSAEYFTRDFIHMVRILALSNDESVKRQITRSTVGIFTQQDRFDDLRPDIALRSHDRSFSGGSDRLEAENAKLIMSLLSSSLRLHYFFKHADPSPCADLFKFAARDIYNVIFALDPRILPHWKDLKRNVRTSTQNQLKKQHESDL